MSTASTKYTVHKAPRKQCATYDDMARQENKYFPFDTSMSLENYARELRTTGTHARVILQYDEWLARPTAMGPTLAELELEEYKRVYTM